MNTEGGKPRTRFWPIAVLLAISCSDQLHVVCAPTPTCSLRAARFEPTPVVDAGPRPCYDRHSSCSALQASAGGRHSCAVTEASNVLCWGDNGAGQRGFRLPDPVDLVSDGSEPGDAGAYLALFPRVLNGAQQVAAGGAHTCALGHDGGVRCWGRNIEGQVASPAGLNVIEPTRVDLPSATQVAAGALHSCALVPDQGVFCWGSSQFGQAGRAVGVDGLAPTLVPKTRDAVAVAAGVRHSCALLTTQRVLCWGELVAADGGMQRSAEPSEVSDLTDAIGVSAGAGHSCALTSQGNAVCWGDNGAGQLGDGTTRSRATPQPVLGLVGSTLRVAAGGGEHDGMLVGHSCAIDKTFQVLCWGRNAEGQLGIGLGGDEPSPHVVLGRVQSGTDEPTLSDLTELALGGFHTCALRSSGALFCWGDNSAEQLGWSMSEGNRSGRLVPGRAVRVRRFGSVR